MTKLVLNFNEFNSINENNSTSKVDLGILGPFNDGVVKIRIPRSVDKNYIFHEQKQDSHSLSYGDSKISLPIKCLDRKGYSDFDVLKINTSLNWFNDKKNIELLDEFLEDYISSKISPIRDKSSSVCDDIELMMDTLGVDCSVSNLAEIDKNTYEADLNNGMQVELDRKGDGDLFKSLRVYKDSNEIHPVFILRKNGGKFSCRYKTDKGTYNTSHDKIQTLISDPMDQYLLSLVTGRDTEETQKKLVDNLLKMLKYHSMDSDQNIEDRKKRERKEIMELMDVLKNTIPESHIEEMYTDARSNFSPK